MSKIWWNSAKGVWEMIWTKASGWILPLHNSKKLSKSSFKAKISELKPGMTRRVLKWKMVDFLNPAWVKVLERKLGFLSNDWFTDSRFLASSITKLLVDSRIASIGRMIDHLIDGERTQNPLIRSFKDNWMMTSNCLSNWGKERPNGSEMTTLTDKKWQWK